MFLKGPHIIKKLRQRSLWFYCPVEDKNTDNLVPMIQGHHGMTHRQEMSHIGTLPHELSIGL